MSMRHAMLSTCMVGKTARSWRRRSPWRRLAQLAFAPLLPLLAACPTPGVYRTARTLNPGQLDVGTMVSVSHFESPGVTSTQSGMMVTGPSSSGTLPSPVPEFSLHYGIVDDLEVGGRVALGAFLAELDLKLRLVGNRDSATNLAIAPSIGYAPHYGAIPPAFLLITEGPRATFPLILTEDISRRVALNFAAYVSYRRMPPENSSTNVYIAGGNLGVEIRLSRGYVMPMIDVSQTLNRIPSSEVDAQTTAIFGVAFGAYPRGK
jgi:hypothetical protein